MNDELKAFEALQHVSPTKFSTLVKEMVARDGTSYLEAISFYCQKFDIEVESVKSLITPDVLDKLVEEGEQNHTIKKSGRLKI